MIPPLDSRLRQRSQLHILWKRRRQVHTRARLPSPKAACVSLPLRRLSLPLKAIPVAFVFLRQGRGRGNEVAEGQRRERGGRRKRRAQSLKRRRGHLFFLFRPLRHTLPSSVPQLVNLDEWLRQVFQFFQAVLKKNLNLKTLTTDPKTGCRLRIKAEMHGSD